MRVEGPHPVAALKVIREHVFFEGQTAFARRIGVSVGTLSTWENGHRVPPLRTLAGIARILGYELDQLYEIAGAERPRLPTPARRPYDPPSAPSSSPSSGSMLPRPRISEADQFDAMAASVTAALHEQGITDPAVVEHVLASIRNAQYGHDPMRRHIVAEHTVDAASAPTTAPTEPRQLHRSPTTSGSGSGSGK